MKNRHTTIYYNKAEPLNFCGKVIGFQANVIKYEIPFEIEPTKGEHDFTTCEICQKQIGDITEKLTLIFEGNKQKIGFPFCCDVHKGLLNFKEFNRADFVGVPKMIAKKIIYTNQHIDNNLISENWYKLITDYIDWAIDSFGKLPNITPLYLEHYFNVIIFCLHEKKEIEKEKKTRLLEYLNLYQTPTQSLKTDFNILLSTYQKWLKIFPFELNSYFGNLKQHFEKQLPLFSGQPEINMYSGIVKVKMHTKSSLIEALINLTNELIDKINTKEIIKKGIIPDPNIHIFDLDCESLRIATSQITKDFSKGELKYINALKKWLNLHKEFFKRNTPLLKDLQPPQTETEEKDKTRTNVFCKSMDLSIPKEHFKVFTEKSSKNGNTFLTVEQLNLFIDRAFCGNNDLPKQKFNQAPKGEKLLIQNEFYDFYEKHCFEYFNTMQCQDIFIKILTENFEGWDFNNVHANFTPKTKKRI